MGTSSSLEFHSDMGGVVAITLSAADPSRARLWQDADLLVCGSQPRKARGPFSFCGLPPRKSRKSYPPDQPTIAATGVAPVSPRATPASAARVAPADPPQTATLLGSTSTRPPSNPGLLRARTASTTSRTCTGKPATGRCAVGAARQ